MLDSGNSRYHIGLRKNGEKVLVYLNGFSVWCVDERGEILITHYDGYDGVAISLNSPSGQYTCEGRGGLDLVSVKPIDIEDMVNNTKFDVKIQWCEKEAQSIRLRETELNYLIRGFSEGQGINYCIKLNENFKFIVYFEFNERDVLFTSDTFEEAKSWCKQNVLKEMGYK